MSNDISLWNLPDEIQVRIFSYLSPIQLCRCVSPVCRKWRRLSCDPSLWKRLEFLAEHYHSLPVIQRLLDLSSQLCFVSFSGRNDLEDVFSILCNSSQYLEGLTLNSCSGLEIDSSEKYKKHSENIKYLKVSCTELDGIDKFISNLFNLRVLNLHECFSSESQFLVIIAETCVNLEKLNVHGVTITDEVLAIVCEERRDTLKNLSIYGKSLTEKGYFHLQNIKHLTLLDISSANSLTDEGLLSFEQLEDLVILSIDDGKQLTSKALTMFFSKKFVQNFKFVSLSGCRDVDETVVRQLTNNCTHLKHLSLSWCQKIDNNSVRLVNEKLKQLEVLEIISLPKISEACFENLSVDSSLRYIDVEFCSSISCPQLLEDLVKKIPSLTIFDRYGFQVLPHLVTTNCKMTKAFGGIRETILLKEYEF